MRKTTFLAAGLLLGAAVHAQADRYVDPAGGDGGNDCLNHASPCASIGHAVDQAGTGDTIHAAAGVFTESFEIDKSLTLQGAGTASTILQAHGQPGQASGRVLFVASGHEVTIRGMTIRHGNAISGSTTAGSGAGLYNDGADLSIESVVFMDNIASSFGGGMFTRDASPTMHRVAFLGNLAGRGGGLYVRDGSPSIVNGEFRANHAGEAGGGIYNIRFDPHACDMVLVNVLVSGNRAGPWGGGIYNHDGCSPVLINLTVTGNLAAAPSGTQGSGGGMYTFGQNANPQIRNSIFWNNQAGADVGTAAANLHNNNIGTEVRHSLVQGCKPAPGEWNDNPQGFNCGTDGGNNLVDANPQFNAPPSPAAAPTLAGNLRLGANSPAIDSGNNAFVAGVDFDLDGLARISGNAVDLGPYEHGSDVLFSDRFEQ